MLVHLAAADYRAMHPGSAVYSIRIRGHLGATLLSAFPAMVSEQQDPVTILTGRLDRSALYGVLAEIEALGLDLLDVHQLSPEDKSSEPDDDGSP
jgi:hypothetical protein